MIKLRLNPYSSTETEYKIEGIKNLKEEVDKILLENNFTEEQLDQFIVIYNGEELDEEFQREIKIDYEDNITIAPRITGGNFGTIVKTVAIIAVTYYSGGVYSGFAGAMFTAGVSIGATLLLNSLIPPPQPGGADLGGFNDSVDNSQMYSLSGQSNRARKYQTVPKVYGTYKIHPTVAAQPYTDIETDPSTGKLVQVLYAIYDFGLGPCEMANLKIGETDIGNFSDLEYNLVDLNKPDISEGLWDDAMEKQFTLYKGDVELVEDTYVLNKNKEGSIEVGDISDYQVIRTGPTNPFDLISEISVLVTFPKGIRSFADNGASGTVTVEMDLEFAVEGTEDWIKYNDKNEVSKFYSTGGQASVFSTEAFNLFSFTGLADTTRYSTISGIFLVNDIPFFNDGIGAWEYTSRSAFNRGLPVGRDYVELTDIGDRGVGDTLVISGRDVGLVTAIDPIAGGYKVTFSEPLTTSLTLYTLVGQKFYSGFVTEELRGSPANRAVFGFTVLGLVKVTANDSDQYFTNFKFTPRIAAQYKIRLTRVRTTTQFPRQPVYDMSYISTTTRFDSPTIITTKRHLFLELKIRATNQINGSLNNLNAEISSILPVYNTTTELWELQATSNPAWIFADLITGEVNKKAVSQDRLHLPSLIEWSEYADEIPVTPPSLGADFLFPRFLCNFVLDYSTTLKDLLDSIGGSTQASLNIIEGKYGVLLDVKRTIPVQVFTPRNYDTFTSNRSYSPSVEGVKVKYNNPIDGWQLSEKVIYADGFNEDNLTQDLEELQSFGITNTEQAWRYGRYMLSQAALRQENISITVDFENLVCTRGDYVQFTQDAMKVGGRPARVKTVSGIQITIDDGIDTQVGPTYGYVYRGVSGIKTSTLTPISSDTFDLDGDIPSVGDLIVIGEVGNIVIDCIVKSIVPQDNLSASVVLVEKADAIYDSMETGVIEPYSPQITQAGVISLTPPGEVLTLQVTDNFYEVGEGQFNYFVELKWSTPETGGVTELYEVYVDEGKGYNLFSNTKEVLFQYPVNNNFLGVEHKFKILAVSSGGRKLNLGEVGFVTETPVRKTTAPANVSALNINITNQVIQLDWTLLDTSEGVRDYVLRYNPSLEGTWLTSIPLTIVNSNTSSTSAQGRKGTYLIKAVDFEGNESEESALAITSIPELFDLNVIEETNDFPTLAGTFDRVQKIGDTLVLEQSSPGVFHPEGFYYFNDILDLGENFTVRIQSLIEAGGYVEGDLMVNWLTLDSVLAMTTSTTADWDVEAQVRINDQINFIESWQPMSDVVTMAEGDIDDWSPYQKFIMGDFTGRKLQFRLKLISNVSSVSPQVFDGVIRSDMPDRTETGDNILSSVLGTTIEYDPAFKGAGTTPAIQITQDSASQGDYFTITSKTLDGFTITFFDNTDTAVARQFDYSAKGYGYKNDTYIT